MRDRQKSFALIKSINNSLQSGTKYFRKSDGEELKTIRSIVEAFTQEGKVFVVEKDQAFEFQIDEEDYV